MTPFSQRAADAATMRKLLDTRRNLNSYTVAHPESGTWLLLEGDEQSYVAARHHATGFDTAKAAKEWAGYLGAGFQVDAPK